MCDDGKMVLWERLKSISIIGLNYRKRARQTPNIMAENWGKNLLKHRLITVRHTQRVERPSNRSQKINKFHDITFEQHHFWDFCG